MQAPDHPLVLRPHFAERVWGGSRLGPGIGEAWDLSVHPNGPCEITNGPLAGKTLAEVAAAHEDAFGGPIRLLAKRLDCRETLSVQVHPKEGDPKTEAWVVLDAEEKAGVYHGFAREVTADEVRRAARDGSLPMLLRFVGVSAGDAVFVRTGTVHAIGAGLFLFEIQQSADTTYRLFDWGRGRDLHLEPALACADLDARPPIPSPTPLPDGRTRLLECELFRVDRLEGAATHGIDPGATWAALLVLEGGGTMDGLTLGAGETLIVPRAAGVRDFVPAGESTLLLYGPA